MIRKLSIAFLTAAAMISSADTADKFCRLAERDFSRSEIAFITSTPAVDKSKLRSAAEASLPALASLLICERSKIKLSEESTRKTLAEALMLMSENKRSEFDLMLKKRKLSEAEWLDMQSKDFASQLNDAVRRWYVKNHAEKDEIKFEHIQAWYYRNGDIFRRIKVNKDKLWAFALPGGEQKMNQALSALKQGMRPEDVRKTFALPLNEETLSAELHKHLADRRQIADSYMCIKGSKYIFLMQQDALEHAYVKLDKDLEQAIRSALQEALAKGRFSEVLKKEFATQKIHFY